MFRHLRRMVTAFLLLSSVLGADDALYRYEGSTFPYDPSAGWVVFDSCSAERCEESVESGHFVLRWVQTADPVNYGLSIARPPEPAPPTLWLEWRFRSNVSDPAFSYSCDGHLAQRFATISDLVYMFADAAYSFSGDSAVTGLIPQDYHVYRFESPNGKDYRVSVDGRVFVSLTGDTQDNGYANLQFGAHGGCTLSDFPVINEWDFVRYGTIAYGEQVVASDPPGGFLDARKHADLDCFAVTFDSPNYVYVNEVSVERFPSPPGRRCHLR